MQIDFVSADLDGGIVEEHEDSSWWRWSFCGGLGLTRVKEERRWCRRMHSVLGRCWKKEGYRFDLVMEFATSYLQSRRVVLLLNSIL